MQQQKQDTDRRAEIQDKQGGFRSSSVVSEKSSYLYYSEVDSNQSDSDESEIYMTGTQQPDQTIVTDLFSAKLVLSTKCSNGHMHQENFYTVGL